jgi:hypothetical protein
MEITEKDIESGSTNDIEIAVLVSGVYHPGSLRIACSTCGAKPGVPCKSMTGVGVRKYWLTPHIDRNRDAQNL